MTAVHGCGGPLPALQNRGARGCVRTGVALVALAAIMLAGCGIRNEQAQPARAVEFGAVQAPSDPPASATETGKDYDPWEGVNERTFWFNYEVLDRYGLKPAAKAWNRVVPEPITKGLDNAFENLDMPVRLVNNVLQGRLQGANRVLTRFLVNSTIGIAGFFDVARRMGFEPSGADMGQTLGTYGIPPGPYLVIPFMYPSTVRDGIGYAFDTLLDPIGLLLPIAGSIARSATRRVNERARNIETYEQVEESSLDFYAAVRNAYLQRRAKSIREGIQSRDRQTALMWAGLRSMLFLDDDDTPVCRNAGGNPLPNSGPASALSNHKP